MSMHEMEAYVEAAVRAASKSDLTTQEKRNLIYSLFQMEEYDDCGFTNLRTSQEMIDCQYTFRIPVEEIPDYPARQQFYQDVFQKDAFGQGDVYPTGQSKVVFVDSGSDTWYSLVKSGVIQGEGAQPVEWLGNLQTLRMTKKLLGDLDEVLKKAHLELFWTSGAIDELPQEEYPEQFGMTKDELSRLFKNE